MTSLIKHDRITTTHAKAKAVQVIAEKLVRFGKENTIHAKQRAARVIREMVDEHGLRHAYLTVRCASVSCSRSWDRATRTDKAGTRGSTGL